jgi:hypothetical protein
MDLVVTVLIIMSNMVRRNMFSSCNYVIRLIAPEGILSSPFPIPTAYARLSDYTRSTVHWVEVLVR